MLRAAGDERSVLVGTVVRDEYGLPLFTDYMFNDPRRVGDTFTLVRYSGGRPVESFEMRIAGQDDPDFAAPFRTVSEWTGKGFKAGAGLGLLLFFSAISYEEEPDEEVDPDEFSERLEAGLLLAAGSTVIGTVGGFVVGVGESIPVLAQQIERARTDKKLVILHYSDYLYDKEGRLMSVNDYSPFSEGVEMRVSYLYDEGSLFPYRMERFDNWGNMVKAAEFH